MAWLGLAWLGLAWFELVGVGFGGRGFFKFYHELGADTGRLQGVGMVFKKTFDHLWLTFRDVSCLL